MSRPRVLLVDDDPDFLHHFELLSEELLEVDTAMSSRSAEQQVRDREPDAVLLDVDLGSGADGIELLKRIRRDHPDLPVIMVSGDERPETVVAAMKAGAQDYVSKRPNLELLKIKIQRALDQVAWKVHAREFEAGVRGRLVGSSPAMRAVRAEIARVAPKGVRVLILGESGTGKELVAAAIHEASPRSRERFVTVSGPMGGEGLFESDLFGHEKGAFTGADHRRRGKFQQAAGGTLFLDEVGKMGLAQQAKLLRVVETGRFEPVGGEGEVAVDVRLLAASNEDLERRIARGEFLEDLYYRLSEYHMRVPPLRDRLEDIPELACELYARFAAREGTPSLEWDPADLELLKAYTWPGNVRELDTVLKRAAILAEGSRIEAEHLAMSLEFHRRRGESPESGQATLAAGILIHEHEEEVVDWSTPLSRFMVGSFLQSRSRLMRAFDRLFIRRELRRHRGNVTKAAQTLGVSRANMYRKIQDLGLQEGD